MNKINSLQIFRGLASIMVLLAHSNLMLNKNLFGGAFIPGRIGVDFFFVLSGFIIMLTCKKNIGSGMIGSYFAKRFLRLFPAYIIYTSIAFFISYTYEQLTGTRIIYWVYINAFNFMRSISLYPFSIDNHRVPILPVAWTLTYEMVFYLFFSTLLFIKKKKSIIILAYFWVLLIFFASNPYHGVGSKIIDVFLSSRNIEFIIGCIMGYYANKVIPDIISVALLLVGLVLISISWIYTVYIVNTSDFVDWILYGIPFSFIIFGATRLEHCIHNKNGAILKFLIYLGDASYSIYLVHFITIIICRRTINDYGLEYGYISFIVSSLASLFVALVMYELIEKPIIKLSRRLMDSSCALQKRSAL